MFIHLDLLDKLRRFELKLQSVCFNLNCASFNSVTTKMPTTPTIQQNNTQMQIKLLLKLLKRLYCVAVKFFVKNVLNDECK